ncbi:Nramp family divalent metal transporter [Desulfoplanes formicivorans]|uniref:Iron transporter n=1 Tax=Desulfoplanes formicivorans TaxID=1592317 RepID=A0A194AIY5_9BACT|nr:Nramp family divalent metal transporter [Desulfoplanes formicivorans]GAU09195.1 iron transporter [Desulfoplanes formicivorans]
MNATDGSQAHAAVSSSTGLISRFGPAWVISAVAAGPATMASVAMAGGTFGYSLLWVVVLSGLLACVNQYMAAKTGIIAGKGIIRIVEERWGRTWAMILMIDALVATWLAAAALMKALVGVTGLVTGWSTPWWGLFWTSLLGFLLVRGGYGLLERVSKVLVALVVLCFMITAITIRPDPMAMLAGLVPSLPNQDQAALMMAAIMGGAVHITIIAMHSYTVNQRGWQTNNLPLAALDTFLGMFVAFGLYSTAIFITGAAWLHPRHMAIHNVFDLAHALTPVLGPLAGPVFLAGLLAAVLSTITPTFMAGGFFMADTFGWKASREDKRFHLAILAGCLVSLAGPLLPGGWLIMLVVMLAMGLCGTPLIIAMNLILLNSPSWAGKHTNGLTVNLLGVISLMLTLFLAGRWILIKLGGMS